jgi:hypothetical protein
MTYRMQQSEQRQEDDSKGKEQRTKKIDNQQTVFGKKGQEKD